MLIVALLLEECGGAGPGTMPGDEILREEGGKGNVWVAGWLFCFAKFGVEASLYLLPLNRFQRQDDLENRQEVV